MFWSSSSVSCVNFSIMAVNLSSLRKDYTNVQLEQDDGDYVSPGSSLCQFLASLSDGLSLGLPGGKLFPHPLADLKEES